MAGGGEPSPARRDQDGMDSGSYTLRKGTKEGAVVLLPGFATDWRIFEALPLACDRIFPAERRAPAAGWPETLAAFLRARGGAPVAVLGWSLGGFLGAAFAKDHPDLVRHLVLVGVRRRYHPMEIDRFRRSLEDDRTGCLEEFYARCFLPDRREAYKRFRKELMPHYLREMESGALMEALRYLGAAELSAEALPDCPITFVHGEKDVVAPLPEVSELATGIPRTALRVLPRAPHAAFLGDGFLPILEGCLG